MDVVHWTSVLEKKIVFQEWEIWMKIVRWWIMHNQRKKGKETQEWSRFLKYGAKDQEIFGWKNNLKQNTNYNTCQKRNKNIEIKLSTQP
jgi:hypothetical protein